VVQTLKATYDGTSFRPDVAPALKPNTRVRIVVSTEDEAPSKRGVDAALLTAYQEMASDEKREAEALEWAEHTVGDVADAAR